MEDEGAQYLADALRTNKVSLVQYQSVSYHYFHLFTQTLTALSLCRNNIGHMGGKYLADVLQDNTVSRILAFTL